MTQVKRIKQLEDAITGVYALTAGKRPLDGSVAMVLYQIKEILKHIVEESK